MTEQSKAERFRELDAGRVLGDLDASEWEEWAHLSSELRLTEGENLDYLAGELEAALHNPKNSVAGDSEKVSRPIQFSPPIVPLPAAPEEPKPSLRRNLVSWIGWAVAACLLGLLLVRQPESSTSTPVGERRDKLVKQAQDLQRLPIIGTAGIYADVSGELLWSDAFQEGYMTLTHLPENDAGQKQYQLWIVDHGRDDIPVDGGVFDIPSDGKAEIVAIQAKLLVKKPSAFVITLEKPGGVVRSKQEVVVAVAKQ